MNQETSVPTETASASVLPAGRMLFPVVAAALGATLIAIATGTVAPLLVLWPLMLVAFLLSCAIGWGRMDETLAGFGMFGVSLLVAGLSHFYQLAVFGTLFDSNAEGAYWHVLVRDGFSHPLPAINAPYAINIWRATYTTAAALGLGNEPWIAIALNTVVMGAAATVIARMAAILFPDDRRRLSLVVVLTLLSPTFWLFGGLWVRDSFALLLHATAILVVVHLLVRRVTFWRLLTHLAVIALLIFATLGIRREMLLAFPVMAVVALVALSLQGRGLRRPFPVLAGIMIVGGAVLLLLDQVGGAITKAQEAYLNIITNFDFASYGLGFRLVVSQPLPIRLVTGTIYMHVFPIPFWSGFSLSAWDYLWLKSFGGVFMIALTPLAAAGFLRAVSASLRGERHTAAFFFLALYWPLMVAGIALTSLETRHMGQFLPVFILLAAIPDLRDRSDWRLFRRLAIPWYGVVALGHVVWLLIT